MEKANYLQREHSFWSNDDLRTYEKL